MRLISCYIEGYGKIKQQEYTFNDGITSICEENGAGKTTLASFIRAMFYGLKGYTEKSTDFCDREHFYPFDKGKFGGNLTFEFNGKTYRIERFFGEKSTKNDTVSVYCGGERTDEFGEDIGKAVFGVDEESFLRTVFIGSGEIEIRSTSSINAKLGSFLHGAEEEGNYDKTLKLLDDARKVYQSDRRSRVANNLIQQEEENIERLRAKIANAEEIQKNLDAKYLTFASLTKEIEELNKRIATAQTENERLAQFEHYEKLLVEIERLEKELAGIIARYPKGLPTAEETNAVNELLLKNRELQTKRTATEFSVKDGEKLARLEESFARGIPTEEELLAVENEIEKLSRLETEIGLELAKEPTERERKLLQKFAHGCPSAETLSKTAEKVEKYKQTKKEYDETPAMLISSADMPAPKKSFGGYLVGAIVALLLCVGGLAVLATVDKLIGGVLLGVGVLLLFGDAFLYLNKKSSVPQVGSMSAMNPEKQRKETALRGLEDGIKAVLLPYGYHSDNGVVYDFAEMQKDVADYQAFLSQENERKAALADKQEQKKALEQKLTAFFRGYGLAGDTYIKLLSDLRSMMGEYQSLKDRKNALATDKAALDSELAENREKIEAYKTKYGLTEIRVNEILEDIREHARLRAEIEREKAQAEAYRTEKGLSKIPVGEKANLGELNEELSEKQNARVKVGREIEEDETEAERLGEYETELSQAKERLDGYKQKSKLLKAAKEFLVQADGSLKDKYVKPILDEFLRYAEIIKNVLGEKVTMTKNFEVLFEKDGEYRSERYLSSGQRSICALCFRLALIKNMYKENLPFLVLDDPFVCLDEEYMEKVKKVLLELSKEMQMLYFTCHESRRI
nr:AAA family ATPase [Clostridia bacterium]